LASEVKRTHHGILKILLRHLEAFLVRPFPWACTAFSLAGLQPAGCTKQQIEVEAESVMDSPNLSRARSAPKK
jgi:hypothetical protein